MAPLLAGLLLLAACAPAEPTQPAPPPSSAAVDETLGVVRVPAGSPVLVRLVLDGDDDPESLGPIIEAAFRTALEDFGAVQRGFRVEVGTIVATDCSREAGERVGAELAAAAADGVVAALGPQCAATLQGLQSAAGPAGLVVVTPRVQDHTFTEGPDGSAADARTEGVWRTAPSLLHEALAAAEYALDDLGNERAAVVFDDSVESRALAIAFQRRFESLGGTVVVSQEAEADLTSDDPERSAAVLDRILDAVSAGEVGVAFLALPVDALLALSDGWQERSRLRGVDRITTSRAAVEDFLGDEASLDHLIAGPVLDFPEAVSAVTGMSAEQTRERISSLSGRPDPAGWWAYAYDAATLLLKAIEDASLVDADGTFVLSRADLRRALASTTFRGLTGPVACGPLGDCAPRLIAIRDHQDTSATDLRDVPLVAIVEH
jgi:branched-chain amino acid transport system substrate-binding protein